MLLPPVDARRFIDTYQEVAVAALGPELRRSCNDRCRVLKASGHLHHDQARAPLRQGDGVHGGLDLP